MGYYINVWWLLLIVPVSIVGGAIVAFLSKEDSSITSYRQGYMKGYDRGVTEKINKRAHPPLS